MPSTKRLLFSATGLLLSAGPGVAATHAHAVNLVNASELRRADGNRGRARFLPRLRCYQHDGEDETIAPTTTTTVAPVVTDPAGAVVRRTRIAPVRCAPWSRPPTTARPRPHGSTTVITIPAPTTVPPTTTPAATTLPTTVAPTTTTSTTVAPTTTTTSTTVAPTTTTTSTTVAPTTTTTVAPTTTTTVAPTTTTTVAPTTTTTTAPPATAPTVALTVINFSSFQTLVPPGVTGGDAQRGFAMQATVANPTAVAQPVTITIDGSAPGAFPAFFEAKDYGSPGVKKAFTCLSDPNTDNGLYYSDSANDVALLKTPTFSCTGTLAAGQSSVVTISSGSKVGSHGSSPAGTPWQVSVAIGAQTPRVVGGNFS